MTFKSWTKTQTQRDDMVGDLSRDLMADKNFDGTQKYVKNVTKGKVSEEACKRMIKEYKDHNEANRLIKGLGIPL